MIQNMAELYERLMTEKADPRTADWFLISSPLPSILITLVYLVITKQGPKWMNERKAFDLKPLMVVYNFFLVLLSVYMFWEFFASSFLEPSFSLTCQVIDYSKKESSMRLANVIWWYYFSKIIEFMDTIIFILRKKNNQISFLHVYHHSTMVLLWWVGVRFVPGGESYFSALINSFVHIVMYGYYMLSAIGPHMQKYLWWKKYITSLQLAQFFTVVMHTLYASYLNCGYPQAYMWALVIYCFSHIALFSNFYHKTYIRKTEKNGKEMNGNCINGIHPASNGLYTKVANGTTLTDEDQKDKLYDTIQHSLRNRVVKKID